MERAVISTDVLARYARDAALEVEGVSGLVGSAAEVTEANGSVEIDLHVELVWGARGGDVARAVQARVADYVEGMADVQVGSVDVVVDRVGAPPAKR